MSQQDGALSSDGGRSLRDLVGIPVARLKNLPPKKEAALEAWGVESVYDLLFHFPRRYLDRTRRAEVADLGVGEEAAVFATVERASLRRDRRGRARVELAVADDTGTMSVVFFNQSWRARQLGAGTEALFFGKVGEFRGQRQLVNPVVDVIVGVEEPSAARRTLRIVPIYPASAKAGLTSWEIGAWAAQALARVGEFRDPLPEAMRERVGLVDRTAAMWGLHSPEEIAQTVPARRRMVFDEFFRLQLALVVRRRLLEADARAIRHAVSPREVTDRPAVGDEATAQRPLPVAHTDSLVGEFLDSLPFRLTLDQRRALAVIFADMAGPLPMHRLLQGDVGSGKTVVALASLLAAVAGRHQGALMVPTEVLAEQHNMVVRAMTEGLTVADPARLGGHRPVAVALLTGRVSASARERIRRGLASGEIDIVIGTHALLTDDISFSSLGLAVIDEQHRFGVEQRAMLRDKGRSAHAGGADPDLLVMTATPIPRTAAMVLFGDLDLTVLEELPPGRTPITTRWARTDLEAVEAWERVRSEVAAGRRAYVVCPLVEGSERVASRSATEEFERLGREELAGVSLGLIHGQMRPADKEAAMAAFRDGATSVLVATTVIEVGVDVPEATVMVIEDAGHFGIAQLHQLRGRVGRGADASWCYLLGDEVTDEGAERLSALERTTDGFELAEVDLELRGTGTILGERQKGRSDLQLAKLPRDGELLTEARAVAEEICRDDPRLGAHPELRDEVELFLDEEEATFLFKS